MRQVLAASYRTTDISELGMKTVCASALLEVLHQEMRPTFEHVEKYGWALRPSLHNTKELHVPRNTSGLWPSFRLRD